MMRSKSKSRLLKLTAITVFCFMQFSMNSNSFGQCQPYIKLDGTMMIANSVTATGLTLPYWLKAGQTLAADQMVQSISVVEFTVTGTNALEFSQVKKVTTVETVPGGKVWKIESIAKTASLSSSNGAVWSGAGTYSLTVPSCASYVCIDVWGGGGGGYDNVSGCGSGGGGAYGQGCFTVIPGSTLSVTVGDGGMNGVPGANGGTTSVTGGGTGVNISASGGSAGASNAGGAGGSVITATVAVAGSSGSVGTGKVGAPGGAAGGSPANPGGLGGNGGTNTASGNNVPGVIGSSPGGGGGGGCLWWAASPGSKGAPGKVIITW